MKERGTTGAGRPQITGVPRVHRHLKRTHGRGTTGNDNHLGRTCVGCAIVKGDHAPDCGVAQRVIHGVFRHHGKNQEEVEEELEKEVERQEEENAQTPMRMTMTMDEMERHCEALEPM